MKLEKRLRQAREHLAKAKENPEENKLYIEDLEQSISTFESLLSRGISTEEGFGNALHEKS